VIYQHPLAYLLGLEGLALMRAWAGEYDEDFVRARLAEVRALLDDEVLTGHPGVRVTGGATGDAYRQWAPSYDDPGNELLELDLPLIDEILADVPAGDAVDAACGTGRLAARLAARGHRVTGVDESGAMLEQARARVGGVRFVAGSLHDLPLAADSADVLTTGLALTHVPDLGPSFLEFARVLRPGGTAIVSDVHPELLYRGSVVKSETASGEAQVASFHRHSVADYVRAALMAGFRLRRLEEVRNAPVGDPDPSPEEPRTEPGTEPGIEPRTELGPWRLWPWTLLDRIPEAARAAWDNPALLVLHLELP
jgi:SAM-dependent methyltransferase